MESAPLFVLGCPRSGTTLLADLLSPTRFGEPVESHFITKYARRLSAYGSLGTVAGFNRLLGDILAERPVRQWDLRLDLDEFRAAHLGASYADIVDGLCRVRTSRVGATSWADKTPHYLLDVPLLMELFPRASFVVIVRDGRDVALSLLQKSWGPGNLYACAAYWKACHTETPALARLRADGRLFERVASDTLARHGYSWTHPATGVSVAERLGYRAHDAFHKFSHLVRINTIDALRIRYFGMAPFAD